MKAIKRINLEIELKSSVGWILQLDIMTTYAHEPIIQVNLVQKLICFLILPNQEIQI